MVMVADAPYAPFAACLGASILAAHPERRFDVCLALADGATVPSVMGLRLMNLSGTNPFDRSTLREERRSHVSYLRVMLPELLEAEYARILYLDADIHLERGDLGQLLGCDLGGAVLGAVRDHKQWRTPGRRVEEFRRLGWPAHRYLNSGMLLLDVEACLRKDFAKCVVEAATSPRLAAGHTLYDQSVINVALRGSWTELSPLWNWQFTHHTRYAMAHAEPRLVHLIGPRKPWLDVGRDLPPRFRARPHAFLAEHVPDHPALSALDPVGRCEPARLGRSYLTHWRRWRATEAYLARFPLETTTHPPPDPG